MLFSASNTLMRRCSALLAIFLLLPAYASTPAMFRGRVVELADQPKTAGMIFVMGRNGSLRKVQIGQARVEYADGMPQRFRKSEPSNSLVQGADIRVEAEEASAGLWRARSIEILQVPGSPKPKEYAPSAPKKSVRPPKLSRRST
jgi:hypothetical protein